jgi:hypothetical protein
VDLIHYSIVGILAYIPVWFRARPGRTKASLASELADFVMSGVALAPTPASSAPASSPGRS